MNDPLMDAATACYVFEGEGFAESYIKGDIESLGDRVLDYSYDLLKIAYLLEKGDIESAKEISRRHSESVLESYAYYLDAKER